MSWTAAKIKAELKRIADPDVAKSSQRYFQTGPGEYAAGDRFLGVRVPQLRRLAREFRALPLSQTEILLGSPLHEERQLALLILVASLERCEPAHHRAVYDLYCGNLARVNNWDLVDVSAPAIVGGFLFDRSRRPLTTLAQSRNLWQRRIAIVATQYFIRREQFDDTLRLSRRLLADHEDLIHKATGWMLREVGERNRDLLRSFLDEHAAEMPRTMLRYALEKFPAPQRQFYLTRGR